MQVVEILKTILKSRGLTQQLLAEKAGYDRQNSVSQIFARKNPGIYTVANLLDAMDYDIIVRSRLTDKTEYKVEVGEK